VRRKAALDPSKMSSHGRGAIRKIIHINMDASAHRSRGATIPHLAGRRAGKGGLSAPDSERTPKRVGSAALVKARRMASAPRLGAA
jgi:hypothetical protein